jgi:hypothetical protein
MAEQADLITVSEAAARIGHLPPPPFALFLLVVTVIASNLLGIRSVPD